MMVWRHSRVFGCVVFSVWNPLRDSVFREFRALRWVAAGRPDPCIWEVL